jgi:hypothetical protein
LKRREKYFKKFISPLTSKDEVGDVASSVSFPLFHIKVTQKSALLLELQFEIGKKSFSLFGIPLGRLEWT